MFTDILRQPINTIYKNQVVQEVYLVHIYAITSLYQINIENALIYY